MLPEVNGGPSWSGRIEGDAEEPSVAFLDSNRVEVDRIAKHGAKHELLLVGETATDTLVSHEVSDAGDGLATIDQMTPDQTPSEALPGLNAASAVEHITDRGKELATVAPAAVDPAAPGSNGPR
jgi:hypothetical protein